MELRVLRYFLTVADVGNITKAAEKLHITQPTLSRQLAQLEEETGVQLFDRESRKIKLTNEGMLLCRRAREILQLVDKTEKELILQEELVEGEISIGCGELASVQVIADLIRSFHEKYPHVRFDIHTANADHVREHIDRGLTDIGLLLEPVDTSKYEFIRLKIQENWVVLMRPDDKLADKEKITPKDLAESTVCLVKRPHIKNELASWFGDYYENLNVMFTSNMSTNAAVMVLNGLTYAMVLEGSMPYWDISKICYRPLFPALAATSVIAWKRDQPQSLAVSKFIAHIRRNLLDDLIT